MDRRVLAFLFVAVLAACGGGGSSGGVTPPGGGGTSTPTPTPAPTPTLPATQTQNSSINGSQNTVSFSPISPGVSGSVTLPAASSGTASVTLVLSSTLPAAVPTPQAGRIHHIAGPQVLGAAVTPLAYISITPSAAVTIASTPSFTFTFPAGMLSGYAYVVVYDENNPALGWGTLLGPVSASGTSLSFPAVTLTPPFTLAANDTYIFAIVENGTPLSTPTVAPTATPTVAPTATPSVAPTASPTGSPTSSTFVSGTGSPLPNVTASPGYGWAPYQVATALQYPVQSGWDGTGETVAIIMDANYDTTGLTHYLSKFQIPSTGRSISVTNSVDGGATSASDLDEIQLDIETIAGLAPGANVVEYSMPSLSNIDFIDTINQISSTNAAQVISYSAGGCEFSTETQSAVAGVFAAAAANGIAVVASSGDQGNQCYNGPNTYVNGANWPAVDSNVFSVGGTNSVSGTTFTDSTVLQSSAVWNDATFCQQQCAGGGGVSQFISLPTYQQGLSGASSTTLRNVPDVSMPAEGMAMFDGTSWFTMWGTSWSAPEYAALMAEIYQYCNGSIANPVATPYLVAQQNYAGAFIDVISGNDQFNSSTSYYTAAAGYDNASGLGVPLGVPYVNTLCPNRVAQARRVAAIALQTLAPAGDRVVDVSPRISGLSDLGHRGAGENTRVQLVLRLTGSLASGEHTVIDALQQAGFTIVRTFGNHLVVDATAPSATIERFFRARMENVSEGQYGERYMPMTQAVIPASIAPYVAGITLDNVVTMHVPR